MSEVHMREIIYTGYDGKPLAPSMVDDCFFENLSAPVIRSGAEAFKSYFDVEWYYSVYNAIDPARSLVETVINGMDERSSESNNWPASDALHYLLTDLGVWNKSPAVADEKISPRLFEPYQLVSLSNLKQEMVKMLEGDLMQNPQSKA